MKRLKGRVKRLEKDIENIFNPLYQIRKDLKPIFDLKKQADHRNKYDDGSGQFFKDDKNEVIKNYCEVIKSMIIELAEKYEKERNENE